MRKLWLQVVVIAAVALTVAVGGLGGATAHASSGPCNGGTSWSTTDDGGVCWPANGLENWQDNNNVWNRSGAIATKPSWVQTMTIPTTATAPTQFQITGNFSAKNGSDVISYPEAQLKYLQDQKAVAAWNNITSSWHSGLPGTPQTGDKYEAAYDIWLNAGPGGTNAHEVMIWTDNHNQSAGGDCPPPNECTWPDPTYGNKYALTWNSGTVWFVAQTNSHTGNVDIKAALTKAIAVAWPSEANTATLNTIDYGFEIVNVKTASGAFNLGGVSVTQN